MSRIDLLADIGGTNARVAFREDGAPWREVYLRETADYPSLDALLADVMSKAGVKPTRAIVALPGPVAGESIKLTNLPWRVARRSLAQELGIPALTVINDLEAVAWSLPHLASNDVVTWRMGHPAHAARVVVAPGTGLGVSALVPYGEAWTAVPSEGGHALAVMPRTTPEPMRRLWHTMPSWEDLLSGGGLLRLYQAFGDAPAAVAPAEVTARAQWGEARALEAIGFFSELLGACAGDMAIIFAAKGGCAIAGGVVPALGSLFDVARFIAGFTGKGPYGDYVDTIPLALISHPHPALVGLAALLDSTSRG